MERLFSNDQKIIISCGWVLCPGSVSNHPELPSYSLTITQSTLINTQQYKTNLNTLATHCNTLATIHTTILHRQALLILTLNVVEINLLLRLLSSTSSLCVSIVPDAPSYSNKLLTHLLQCAFLYSASCRL